MSRVSRCHRTRINRESCETDITWDTRRLNHQEGESARLGRGAEGQRAEVGPPVLGTGLPVAFGISNYVLIIP